MICAICDALLIALGVTGMGTLIASSKSLSLIAGIGGAVFLFLYGIGSFRSAIKGGSLSANQKTESSLKAAILTTFAVTLLNPHVYLDTVILLGSISSQFKQPGHIFFGAGAALASFVWFFSLSIGGRMLAPLFTKKSSWMILDTLVGMTMWAIALSVLKGLFAF